MAARNHRTWARLALVLAGLAMLHACATTPAPRAVDLQFLQGSSVTLQDVESRLGPPAGRYDVDHVVAYRLNQVGQEFRLIPATDTRTGIGWKGVTHDLVLAFDGQGKLYTYRLIEIHAQPQAH
jgi:hypothetical protein